MNRTLLLLPLAGLSFLAGYLLSRASLTGKAGISLFYKEYRFLKVWWQSGLVILVTLLAVTALHELIRRKTATAAAARLWQVMLLLVALAGLYFTYLDFRDTLTHRMLGRRFHLGGYLFWVSWILVSLYYLWRPSRKGAAYPPSTH